jgi:hypothetical protein
MNVEYVQDIDDNAFKVNIEIHINSLLNPINQSLRGFDHNFAIIDVLLHFVDFNNSQKSSA